MPRIDSGVYRPHDGPPRRRVAGRRGGSSPGEEPDPRHGSTYNGVGWAHSPTPRESPGTVSPSGNPNGVNPAGSGIPSG